jgi:uncharacterized membrane protein YkoI
MVAQAKRMGKGALIAALLAAALPQAARAQACYSAEDARQHVANQGLMPLQAAIRSATRGRPAAEPVSARLCDSDGTLVYMIALLERDGKVERLTVDARTGKVIHRR